MNLFVPSSKHMSSVTNMGKATAMQCQSLENVDASGFYPHYGFLTPPSPAIS